MCLLLFFQLYFKKCYCILYAIVTCFIEQTDSYMGLGVLGHDHFFPIIFKFFHHLGISFFQLI